MAETGRAPEAREVYEEVLAKEMELYGPEDERVLQTQSSLAALLCTELHTQLRMQF